MSALTEILTRVPTQHLRAELVRRTHNKHSAKTHRIIQAISQAYDVDPEDLRYLRTPTITTARQAAMVLMRRAEITLDAIAEIFELTGPTVYHAVRTQHLRMQSPDYAAKFKRAQQLLKPQ